MAKALQETDDDDVPLPKKNGRPYALNTNDETLTRVRALGGIQATTREAAAVLDVTEKTFIEYLKREPLARDAFENGKAEGCASLRRTQFRLAEHSAAMAIFLGKNLLGQRDVMQVENKTEITYRTLEEVTIELRALGIELNQLVPELEEAEKVS